MLGIVGGDEDVAFVRKLVFTGTALLDGLGEPLLNRLGERRCSAADAGRAADVGEGVLPRERTNWLVGEGVLRCLCGSGVIVPLEDCDGPSRRGVLRPLCTTSVISWVA
jgi:hypothetical protein